MENMDNFALNVRARSQEAFNHALEIAFLAAPGGKASHWCIHPQYGLVLFWSAAHIPVFQGKPLVPFPSELEVGMAASFAWDWAAKSVRSDFILEGDDAFCEWSDAQCIGAWRIYVEDRGHVGNHYAAIAAILPVFAWLGK